MFILGPRKRLQLFLKLSEHSRLFPNIPDFARTLPKARNTVFGVFQYIFGCRESITSIPETIRALPIFPELSRSLKPPYLVRGIDCDYSRNDPSPLDLSRTLPKPKTTEFGVFPYIFKVQGIDLDYSRNDTNTPELSRFFPSSPEI
ncbi:hypothetical protein NQ317_019128 [Molorchus minor]|uniref:Uncharacterized protein n=1 Tax=Molorchus minor TaxID=1323400 RepID=A0ABQ9JH65_9CUCU|nr:hypothetical protein NQ317_019128 [Molorchus minor]